MTLAIQQAEIFKQDYANHFARYVDVDGPELARRFQTAVERSLHKLARRPDLGRPRHFRDPRLQALRSFQVERPFSRILLFYRVTADALQAVRLIHGARHLPRRLLETDL